MSASYPAYLSANRISLMVNLGYGEDERRVPQPVEIDIRLYFPELPAATKAAQDDFICYGGLADAITAFCSGKEFKLIEYLALEIYAVVRNKVKEPAKLWLKLHKCQVPVESIKEGASFVYTDLPAGAWVVPS